LKFVMKCKQTVFRGKNVDPRWRKWEETAENCTLTSYITCVIFYMLLAL